MKQISSIKCYPTNAIVYCTDGTPLFINLDFQANDFFESREEVVQYVIDLFSDNDIDSTDNNEWHAGTLIDHIASYYAQ